MRICGIKLTHDGAVALIDDGRLVFSCEMEKIAEGERYARIADLGIVYALLARHGYDEVDRLAIDGWHRLHRIHKWHGQEVPFQIAPYRRGIASGDVFQEYSGRVIDLDYVSYPHYGGHVASAYCTSPFAKRRESAYVIAWDGHMFPFLYYVDHVSGRATTLGPLTLLVADVYFQVANLFAPFDGPLEFPYLLGVSGKIMAYVAVGSPQPEVVKHFEEVYKIACRDALETHHITGVPSDRLLQADLGESIMNRIIAGVRGRGLSDADMIASLHAFIDAQLIGNVRRMMAESPFPSGGLCLAGGAALNIKWNRSFRECGVFKEVWVPPFPNDAGSAIGAACCAMLAHTSLRALDWDVYCGPPLRPWGGDPRWAAERCDVQGLASLLAREGEPVVVLHGRAELGPRALGNRSILASASDPLMKRRLNTIKEREWYRPIAPICLEHRSADVFSPGVKDPYMLFDQDVRPEWRDRVPAICHLDGTARVQTVNAAQNPVVFELLTHYERHTGIPLLCNTSANRHEHGFFPDVGSAARWGRIDRIWSEGVLYRRIEAGAQHSERERMTS
jgi:carbamoyltransferase